MGAGQIAGMATVLGYDFGNAPGFAGVFPQNDEAQFLVYFLSHTVMFCAGALIEGHVILTAATCVFKEKDEFDVYAGSHHFREGYGSFRTVQHVCVHKAFNASDCSKNNIAILVLQSEFQLRIREPGTQYMINRVRYGKPLRPKNELKQRNDRRKPKCFLYGWGSRRNGLLMPMLMSLMKVEIELLPKHYCGDPGSSMLCIQDPPCKNERFGALCPDDMGSVVVCDGYLRGIMVSRAINRPCGFGYMDLDLHNKFITCGVDDARDITANVKFSSF